MIIRKEPHIFSGKFNATELHLKRQTIKKFTFASPLLKNFYCYGEIFQDPGFVPTHILDS
jgi:hypothetical protein